MVELSSPVAQQLHEESVRYKREAERLRQEASVLRSEAKKLHDRKSSGVSSVIQGTVIHSDRDMDDCIPRFLFPRKEHTEQLINSFGYTGSVILTPKSTREEDVNDVSINSDFSKIEKSHEEESPQENHEIQTTQHSFVNLCVEDSAQSIPRETLKNVAIRLSEVHKETEIINKKIRDYRYEQQEAKILRMERVSLHQNEQLKILRAKLETRRPHSNFFLSRLNYGLISSFLMLLIATYFLVLRKESTCSSI